MPAMQASLPASGQALDHVELRDHTQLPVVYAVFGGEVADYGVDTGFDVFEDQVSSLTWLEERPRKEAGHLVVRQLILLNDLLGCESLNQRHDEADMRRMRVRRIGQLENRRSRGNFVLAEGESEVHQVHCNNGGIRHKAIRDLGVRDLVDLPVAILLDQIPPLRGEHPWAVEEIGIDNVQTYPAFLISDSLSLSHDTNRRGAFPVSYTH